MLLRILVASTLAIVTLGVGACAKKSDDSHQPEPPPQPDKGSPPVAKIDPEAEKLREENRLKSRHVLVEVGLGLCNYDDSFARLPIDAWITGKGEKKPGGLSWRVHLLPFMEQEALYKQFKLDEPWDGPNNKKLIDQMPQCYASPSASADPGKTYFKRFVGAGTLFPGDGTSVSSFTVPYPRRSNIILVVEGGSAVTWTQPGDFPFEPTKPLPDIGLAGSRRVNVMMFNATCRTVDLDKVSEATLKAAITVTSDDVLGPDWETGALVIPFTPKKK